MAENNKQLEERVHALEMAHVEVNTRVASELGHVGTILGRLDEKLDRQNTLLTDENGVIARLARMENDNEIWKGFRQSMEGRLISLEKRAERVDADNEQCAKERNAIEPRVKYLEKTAEEGTGGKGMAWNLATTAIAVGAMIAAFWLAWKG